MVPRATWEADLSSCTLEGATPEEGTLAGLVQVADLPKWDERYLVCFDCHHPGAEDWPLYYQEIFYNHSPAFESLQDYMVKLAAAPDYTCAASSCGKHAYDACAKCEKVRYCSPECAANDLPNHGIGGGGCCA